MLEILFGCSLGGPRRDNSSVKRQLGQTPGGSLLKHVLSNTSPGSGYGLPGVSGVTLLAYGVPAIPSLGYKKFYK